MNEPWHPEDIRLTPQPDGTWKGQLAKIAAPVCDFCADPEPTTDFPCADFLIGEIAFQNPDTGHLELQEHWNQGGFLACRMCAMLIDQGAYPQLVRRMMERWRRAHGEEGDPDPFVTCVAGFAKHRQGPGRDWEGDAAG